MSFDKIFDLTAGVYFYFYNMIEQYKWKLQQQYIYKTYMVWDLAQNSPLEAKIPTPTIIVEKKQNI